MKSPALRFAVAALLLSGASTAHAADSYWVAGLGVGYSRIQFYPEDFSSGGAFSESKKEFDAGFKGFIGHQFNRFWAAELSYATVGKFHYKYSNGTVTRDGVYKVTGVGFSAVPTLPLTRNFSVFGRLGGFFSQTRLTFHNDNFVLGAVSSGAQSNETSLLAGFGAQYFFDGESGMRIEYENFGKVGSGTCAQSVQVCAGRANASMVSVNAIFKF
jgi:OOP family OmpA-OmpF porin